VDPPDTRPQKSLQTRAWLSFRIGKGCAGGGTGFDKDLVRPNPKIGSGELSRGQSS
jgi:hypothetical protein